MSQTDETELSNYLRNDRQWFRSLRIAHARAKIALAQRANEHERVLFYQAVLEALTDNER